jgi:hypothetical protein
VKPCIVAEIYRIVAGIYSFNLKGKRIVFFFENKSVPNCGTLIKFYHTVWSKIPEDKIYSYQLEDFQSCMLWPVDRFQ